MWRSTAACRTAFSVADCQAEPVPSSGVVSDVAGDSSEVKAVFAGLCIVAAGVDFSADADRCSPF